MSESDPALVGVQSCGCVTLAVARPRDPATKKEQREEDHMLAEFVRNGGELRHTTVGEARAMPNFLPAKCPHEPKGWSDP